MNDIITTAACPHCGSGASWRRALPTTGGRPVRLCTVCGRVSVDEDWTVPAGAEPARVLPSREEIRALFHSTHSDTCTGWCETQTERALALFADQPTVEQVKAEALREHRRRVVRFMPAGLVNRATVLADLDDYADRLAGGGSDV